MSTVHVVGAGVIGLASAFQLASRGHRVDVYDPAPASGASHHAGGMLAPTAEVVYRQDALFPLMQESARLYPGLLSELARHTELPTGYRDEGTLVIAADRADARHLQELASYQHEHGFAVTALSTRDARALEPALHPRLAGVVSIPGDTQVAPRLLTRALIDALGNLGVSVQRRAITSRAQLPAGRVIVANGLGAQDFQFGSDGSQPAPLPLPLRPVYGEILRLQAPAHARGFLSRVIRGFVEDRAVYIIPRSDGTLAIGASSREDSRPHPQVGGVYELLRDAIRLVPALEECDFLEATCGARPGTPDDLPLLGPLSEDTLLSTGYFRHGILLAALAARSAQDWVEGTTSSIDLSACAPQRFMSDFISST